MTISFKGAHFPKDVILHAVFSVLFRDDISTRQHSGLIRGLYYLEAGVDNFPFELLRGDKVDKGRFPKSLHDRDRDPTDHRVFEAAVLRSAYSFRNENPTGLRQ